MIMIYVWRRVPRRSSQEKRASGLRNRTRKERNVNFSHQVRYYVNTHSHNQCVDSARMLSDTVLHGVVNVAGSLARIYAICCA
jgi:hypothetical protein